MKTVLMLTRICGDPKEGLAHQLFVHEGTHVVQGRVSPAPIRETLDVFKGAASGLRSCLKGLTSGLTHFI